MPAVLLGRAGRQDDQLLRRDRVVHLRPGQAVVAVLVRCSHSGSLATHSSRHLTLIAGRYSIESGLHPGERGMAVTVSCRSEGPSPRYAHHVRTVA